MRIHLFSNPVSLFLLAFAIFLSTSASGISGPLVVTTIFDHDDGNCTADDCTLREAINLANATNGVDTITFQNDVAGTIMLGSALGLTVTDSVNIVGPGANLVSVSANSMDRVFVFQSGSSTISGLTIRDGSAPNGAGVALGGGLWNQATLIVNDCAFIFNTAHGRDGESPGEDGSEADGGAILNNGSPAGTLTLNRCTFSNNRSIGGDGAANTGAGHFGGNGGLGLGGAVLNEGTLNLNNCTFAGNIATGGSGGTNISGTGGGGADGSGGGVCNLGMMTMTATTVSDNAASGGSGGSGSSAASNGVPGQGRGGGLQGSGTSFVRNTIAAGNSRNRGGGPDVDGAFSSGGYNLIGIGDGSTGFTSAGDQVGTTAAPIDALLGPLQNNGGTTDTIALLFGSPAIDQGKSFDLTTDQRGLALFDDPEIPNAVGGDGRDIGAFELNGGIVIPTVLGNISTRLMVETGNNALIGGFIVTGIQQKKVIVRALGPSLTIAGKLADPILELRNSSGGLVASNDNWRSTQEGEIIATGIPPSNDLESAIVANLPANNSGYTAIVRGTNNSAGVGLVEVYDLDQSADSKLANISTRGLVQTDNNVMIAGTIVLGTNAQRVIVRAIGPSLSVAGVLADPDLELRDANGAVLASNDNWRDTQEQEIIDTGIPPANDMESAIVATLPANGAGYTAVVRGVNNTTGVGLVEVYALN